MNVLVCFKSVFDDVGIRINSDKTLDCSNAAQVVSIYDLNAIEAAAQFAESEGAHLGALTVGDPVINDSTMRKNVCARGPKELFMVMDERLKDAETYQTASVLASAIEKIGDIDLIICGDGSADVYTHQVGIQVGELLGIPNVNAVKRFTLEGDLVKVERELEDEMELVELRLPAVLSVLSDIAQARTCAVKDIMTAGQKPVHIWDLDEVGVEYPAPNYEIKQVIAPDPAPRKKVIFDGSSDKGMLAFFDAFDTYLATEGAN